MSGLGALILGVCIAAGVIGILLPHTCGGECAAMTAEKLASAMERVKQRGGSSLPPTSLSFPGLRQLPGKD